MGIQADVVLALTIAFLLLYLENLSEMNVKIEESILMLCRVINFPLELIHNVLLTGQDCAIKPC